MLAAAVCAREEVVAYGLRARWIAERQVAVDVCL